MGRTSLSGVPQSLGSRSQTQLKSIVRTVDDRFVAFDCVKDRRGIPVVGTLIAEWKSRRIIGMAGHFDVIFLGHGYDVFKEMGDPFPVIVGSNPARFSHGQISPVVFELEPGIGHAASTGHSPVSPNRYRSPMIGDDLNVYPGGLADILLDRFNASIALGALSQPDIVVPHSNGFENNANLVTVVFHSLQIIEIPGALVREFFHCCGQMLYAVAQVVFQVFLRRDIGPPTPATLW